MNTHTAATDVCHLNACQYDTTCKDAAAHFIVILEPGMHMPPADLMACEAHAAFAVTEGQAEFVGPVA